MGDTLRYVYGNQPGAINQIFTPPGGGQQWDLSNLQPTQTWNQIMRDPQTGSASASFPGASMWHNPVNSTSQVYWQVTDNQVLDMGYFGLDELGLGLTLLFKKLPSLEESWAPVNFFDLRQSTSNVLSAFDAPIAPGWDRQPWRRDLSNPHGLLPRVRSKDYKVYLKSSLSSRRTAQYACTTLLSTLLPPGAVVSHPI